MTAAPIWLPDQTGLRLNGTLFWTIYFRMDFGDSTSDHSTLSISVTHIHLTTNGPLDPKWPQSGPTMLDIYKVLPFPAALG